MTDIAISSTDHINSPKVSKKPPYLITLIGESIIDGGIELQQHRHFVSLDKPDLLNGFVQARGFFSLKNTNEGFLLDLSSHKKEDIAEMLFPWHMIIEIENMLFKAK